MKKITLKIEGMTCSACSQGLEKYLIKQKGIINANVNLVLSIATIEYENIKIKDIENYIKKSGFKSGGEFKSIEETDNKQNSKLLILMGIILILVIYISMGHMLNLPEISFISHNNLFNHGLSLLILTIIFIIYGSDILISGIKNIINRMPNMDTLVLLSVTSSFLYSMYNFINMIDTLYFESICMVIYFIKLGRYIEDKSKNKTRDAIKKLVQITPKEATLKLGNSEKQVSIDEIKKDDIVINRAGEKIAVDGIVISGQTYVDESFITGESNPVLKEKGSNVIAGSISYDGMIEYQAKKIGKESTISEIVKLVVEETNTKSKIQRLADKISGYFVYIIVGLAVINLFIQLVLTTELNEAMKNFATVLVVACPCSLGLAVPLVSVISNGLCAKKGLFIRSSEVLENAKDIDTVIFDKTGTITYGKLNIFKMFNYSNYNDNELLNIVSNIEYMSSHPIKTAFKIEKKLNVNDFQTINGIGIKATINDKQYYLGNNKILKKINILDKNIDDYKELTSSGCSIIYIIEDKKVIGLIGVKDTIRKESKATINNLKKNKIEVIMLTGDNEKTASIIAKKLGIDKVIANVSPKEKAGIIKEMINDNKKVIMIGDGINDAPSLVNATIGISVNDGTDIAIDSADVILMNNNMENVLELVNISKKALKIITENLFWAFFYNLCMIPIAMGLFSNFGITISPMIASISMTFSSLTVVLNSLRLGRMK